MHAIATDVLSLIGNTPLVRLSRISAGKRSILVKLETRNPSGSVKDRAALAIIIAAEKSGALGRGGHIVEATSGNTGIALAMVAAVRGYSCTIVMPNDATIERRRVLRAYGAEVVLTPEDRGMRGAVERAHAIAKERHAFLPSQFDNPENPRAHDEGTAQEILATGVRVGAFVAGVGTGGTLTGVGHALRRAQPGVRIVAVEPSRCAVLTGGEPGPHTVFGLGAGFVPSVLDREIIDEVVTVTDEDAWMTAEKLARTEGIFAGPSSGANVFVALAETRRTDDEVVTVICDLGDRYLAE